MYKDKTLQNYLDDLAAKFPAPGGGSAAALNGALGAALVSMVVNFTIGKPKYAAHEAQLKEILGASEKMRAQFLSFVDADVIAYQSKDMQKSLEVPLAVCRLCAEAIELCPPLITKGNQNLISDVVVAAVFFESAFATALCNVDINLKCIGDKELTKKLRRELIQKQKRIKKVRAQTEATIGKIIRR